MNLLLFGISIPLYGVFFWGGIFTAGLVASFISKRKKLAGFDLVGSAIYTMIGAIIGAKLLYVLVSFDKIVEFALANDLSFIEMLPVVIKGGFVFYGGLIGGFIGLTIYARQFKMSIIKFLDIYAIVVPLGHALGRIGCFFAGCCYGINYDGPLSHTYHIATGAAPIGVPLFPVQLFEAACLLLLFVSQMLLFLKMRNCKFIFTLNYAISYSFLRFALEFLRGDSERGQFWFLSTSQWISLAIFAITVFLLIYYVKSKDLKIHSEN